MSISDESICTILRRLRETPALLAEVAASTEPELALQTRLRKEYPDELVRAAINLHELRRRGTVKFSRAEDMWFDRVGLEQATSETVARHKAERFSGEVDDLCCGIGGDAIALGERCRVVAADARRSAVLMTTWNAEVCGVARNVSTRAAHVEEDPGAAPLVHIDPDRRRGAGRSVRIEDYRPDLPFLRRLMETREGGAIKLSPAANFGGKFDACEIELVSLHGECKEATVWFGSLAGVHPYRATVLPAGVSLAADPLCERAVVGPVKGFVYDPDPAIVRSGLVDVLATSLALDRLDPDEEYLTGDVLVCSPFVQAFAVLAEVPNNAKRIRRTVEEARFGQVEIKARHLPIDADAVRRKLPLRGKDAGVLVFARVAGRARVVICRRVKSPHDLP